MACWLKMLLCLAVVVAMATPSLSQDSTSCTEEKLSALRRIWQHLMKKSDNDIVRLTRAVLYYVATDSLNVAQLLRSEYLKEAEGDATLAARMSFDSWFTIISVYPDVERLRHQVHYDAATTTELARLFYRNAPLVAKSILSVLSRTMLPVSGMSSWSTCLREIADTVEHIGSHVNVSAICHVDEDSGLPQYHITGNVVFTQPLYGGGTAVSVSLCGFYDTKKHGFHVHTVGNTGNRCRAAGGHFNPRSLQHGGPNDRIRHVGDLGNIQANNRGKVVTKFTDDLVSLQGTNNVINRAVVIHEDEDDLGRGGFFDSLTTGHAGARIACCVIDPCVSAY